MSFWSECECEARFITSSGVKGHCTYRCHEKYRKANVDPRRAAQSRESNRRSKAQEKRVGRRIPGSGNQPGLKGDSLDGEYLVECKSTNNLTYSVDSREFNKGAASAARHGMDYRFEIEFVGNGRPLEVVIMTKTHYKQLVGEE